MPIWITGFESGLATPSINGGGLFNTINGTGCTIQNTNVRSGDYALQIVVNNDACRVSKSFDASYTATARFYIRFSSLPTTDCMLASFYCGNNQKPGVYYDYTNNRIEFGFTSGTREEANVAISAETWYRIDVTINTSASPCTVDGQVDGTAASQCSQVMTPAYNYSFLLGSVWTTGVYTAQYDDVIVERNATPYPYGEGRVVGLRPFLDGTHNNATGILTDKTGYTITGVFPYYAWPYLDGNPWENSVSGYIQQADVGTGGHYLEVGFEDMPSASSINGVMAYLQYASEGETANNGATYVIDDTQFTQVYSGDMSEISAYYKSAIVTPLTSWSESAVNGLKARFGYSTNVTSHPVWLALLIEVDYVTTGSSPSASVSASISASASASVSASPSPSPSSSISPSPSGALPLCVEDVVMRYVPSASISASPSPSVSASVSASASPSISASPSPSVSASPSATPSPSTAYEVDDIVLEWSSASASASVSASPSASPSATPSPTPSISTSISASPSASISASPSPTPSASPSPTPSPSISASASPSPTPSASISASPSASISSSISASPSPSVCPAWSLSGRTRADLTRVIVMYDTLANINANSATIMEALLAFDTTNSKIGLYVNGAWVWR